ncbi:MAG TPA: hypothetical protein VF297_27220 [Pyrinomonadaceae bacterium]
MKSSRGERARPPAGTNKADAAVPPDAAQVGSTNKGSSEEAFNKAVEGIPVVGATLVFIIKKWGPPGLLLFFFGGVFALGLVYLGVIPGGLVSDKYRAAPPAPDAQEGVTLKGPIQLEVSEAEDGWLQALTDLYRREGVDAQEAEPDQRSSAGAFEYTVQEKTKTFTWELSAQAGLKMTAMAFKVSRDKATGDEAIQQLKPTGDDHTLNFSVPACQKGDKLVAVVRVWSKLTPPPEDIRLVLRSAVR